MANFYQSNFMSLQVTGQFKKKTCWIKKTFNNIKPLKTMKTNKKYIKSKIFIKNNIIIINIMAKIIFLNNKIIRMYFSLF